MSKQYDYLIVGAGLFGATVAYRLVAQGKRVLVIDKRSHIGGNVYTENVEGINVHKYGAHIFHTDNKEVWKFVNRFAEFNRYTNSPIARIGDEIYNMPFNMNTFSKIWPDVKTPEEAKARIEEERKEIVGEPKNLEEQAISLVGRSIYEKLIKGYTEKQWGRPCSELPADIIKRLPVRFTYDNNYFNDRYQGIPIGGYTQMVEKMLWGAEIRLNTDFFDDVEGYKSIADKIIYTGMIDEYFGYQFGHLEYRSLDFVTVEYCHNGNVQGVAVVNWTGNEVPYTRTIEHKHFEGVESDKSILTYEYPAEWSPDKEPYYVINDEKNNAMAEKYRSLAEDEKNVIFGGRLAEYKYYDMDDVIEKALKVEL